MTQKQMRRIVEWCAEECERQRSGERSVLWMFDGWAFAHRHASERPALRHILALGRIVEPRRNESGFRRVNVQVGWEPVETTWEQVPRAMDNLLGATGLSSVAWFQHYETIHPFRDGNGRTGAILLNWLCGSLDEPFDAPMYERPSVLVSAHPGLQQEEK